MPDGITLNWLAHAAGTGDSRRQHSSFITSGGSP
jgi:hypothetical protein